MRHRTPRGSLTHRGAMQAHSQRRLFERHGITMSAAEFAAVMAAIEDGRNPVVAPARGGGTLHAVTLRGRMIYAVWSTELRYIATFLPGIPLEVRCPNISKVIERPGSSV